MSRARLDESPMFWTLAALVAVAILAGRVLGALQ
jgi:hypothetical protein